MNFNKINMISLKRVLQPETQRRDITIPCSWSRKAMTYTDIYKPPSDGLKNIVNFSTCSCRFIADTYLPEQNLASDRLETVGGKPNPHGEVGTSMDTLEQLVLVSFFLFKLMDVQWMERVSRKCTELFILCMVNLFKTDRIVIVSDFSEKFRVHATVQTLHCAACIEHVQCTQIFNDCCILASLEVNFTRQCVPALCSTHICFRSPPHRDSHFRVVRPLFSRYTLFRRSPSLQRFALADWLRNPARRRRH